MRPANGRLMSVPLVEAKVPYNVEMEMDELNFYKDNNHMLFGDAKKMLDEVLGALKN